MNEENEPQRVSVGRPELLALARNEFAFYGLELTKISTVFLAQVIQIKSSGSVDIFNITDEIKALEGVKPKRSTRKERMFSENSILKGLHYTHFMDARFMPANIASEFGYRNGGNKRLDNLIYKLFRKHEGEYVNEGFAQALAHEGTIGAFERRAARGALTGEWIVFVKHKGKRYYLSLAAHSESNEDIFSRVKIAISMDFPFLNYPYNNTAQER